MKLRMRFGKEGMVKFIGHLDIMRYFQKAFRRAEIDLKYSQGFSPHPLMSFASPLGVGLESSGEYLDVEVNSCGDLEEMKDAINAQMAEGIQIFNILKLPDNAKTSMAIIAAASYEISFREGMMPCDLYELNEAVTDFYAQPEIRVIKKTKKSEIELDIKPLIYEMHAKKDRIYIKAASGSVSNIKPELVLSTLYKRENWDIDEYAWCIKRLDMYTRTGDGYSGDDLVSLDIFTQ